MILSQLPDLPPRPLTAANAGFRRWFYQHWGQQNAVILGCTKQAEFPPFTQTLSIKRAWGGREQYLLPTRRLAVDGRHWLVLNEGEHYGAHIASPTAVTSLAVFFRPGMAAELCGAAALTAQQALGRETEACARGGCGFAEHLRPLDDRLERRLCLLRDEVLAGADDEQWLEEQLQTLLWAMLHAEPGWRARSLRLAELSRSAHHELLARVDRAADYMLSCHAQPLTLDDVAAVARLSKYHLVRVFRQVHGVTPMAFLSEARTSTAEGLVRDSGLGLDEVAELSGFGSRQTMFRQLRRRCGASGRALRRGPRA